MGYDRYPEKLIEEKQALYKDFSDKNLQIFFTHDSQWSLGKLEQNEKGPLSGGPNSRKTQSVYHLREPIIYSKQ
jgi:hypothetical protein